jgi:hypothetical protein
MHNGTSPITGQKGEGWPSCLATAACPLPAYQWGVFIHTGDFLKSVFKGQRPLSDKSYKPQPQTSVGDPDPEPDPNPQDPHVFGPAGTGSDPLVRGMDPGIRIRIRICTKMSRIPNNVSL